jgi:predicted amidohydrolase
LTRIAIFQSRTGVDPAASAVALVDAVDQAARGGAEMLFTPEMSGLLDRDADRARRNVTSTDEDRVLAACREAAKRNRIWIHLGSLAVAAEDGRFANRGFVIDSAGQIRASYDKIHLFDVDLPTGESWRESNVYRGGSEAVVVDGTPVGKLGLTICYDLRFPALSRASPMPVRKSCPCPRRSPFLPAGRTGKSCSGRAPSKPEYSSSPQHSAVGTRTGARLMATP